MLSTGKKVREGKRMSATGAAIRDGEPSETAAARDAAGDGGSNGLHASGTHGTTAPGAPTAKAQPAAPPNTVSQVLGEITWLMTQNPRHKPTPLAISNG